MDKTIEILKTKIKIPDSISDNLIVFTRSSAQVLYKKVEIKSTPISTFRFFEVFITIEENQCKFSVHNLGEHLVNFHRNNINDLSIILDAIATLYQLEYFETRQIDEHTNVLTYHSKTGQKSRQIFRISGTKYQFHLYFLDKRQTHLHFDFKKNVLITDNNELIDLQSMDKIILYLDLNETKERFTVFAIEAFLKNNIIKTLIELSAVTNTYVAFGGNLQYLPIKSIFSVVMELIEKLKQQPKLNNIPIKLEIQ